jgi:hypothetical protein
VEGPSGIGELNHATTSSPNIGANFPKIACKITTMKYTMITPKLTRDHVGWKKRTPKIRKLTDIKKGKFWILFNEKSRMF